MGLPLEVECFTFFKEPLGIKDTNKEIIRGAREKVSYTIYLLFLSYK